MPDKWVIVDDNGKDEDVDSLAMRIVDMYKLKDRGLEIDFKKQELAKGFYSIENFCSQLLS